MSQIAPARRALGALAAAGVGALLAATPAAAQSANAYDQTNLVANTPGTAALTDPDLVNAWGLAAGPSTPLWVSDNGSDKSTLYSGGRNGSPPMKLGLVVRIPGGAPTGQVYNDTSGFRLGKRGPALFIFDSEAGRLVAWNGALRPQTRARTVATVRGAIFKGLALAHTASGARLYASDFHNNRVIVWNNRFHRLAMPGRFVDRHLPAGYAPFGIDALRGRIYVTYAKQDADREDDVKGAGHGFVDVYTTNGRLVRRLISRGRLNSPWGQVIAKRSFGAFAGDLLVGNFGNGAINAYDPRTGAFRGRLRDEHGRAIAIDGLWALRFGNATFGGSQALVFSAGPNDEKDGLLGTLTPHR